MATLLPASLHPLGKAVSTYRSSDFLSCVQTHCLPKKQPKRWSGYAWTSSSISLGPYVLWFYGCTFFLHWMLSRSSSKSSSFPDESLRGTVSEEMTTHWIVTLLTSWLQNENCKTPQNTSVCFSFPCHLPKGLFSHYLLCRRSWLTPWRPNLKH